MKYSVVIIGLYFLLAPFLIGCETTPPTLGIDSTLTPAVRQSAQHELKVAWRLYERNEYHQVITKVQHILERYPDSRVSSEAKYLLGLSYFYIDGYPDSVTLFVDYLAESPEGKYAGNCSRLVQHIAIAYEKKYPSADRIRAQLAIVDQELKSTSSLPLKLKRADLNWQLARYDAAGKLYSQLLDGTDAHTHTYSYRNLTTAINSYTGGPYALPSSGLKSGTTGSDTHSHTFNVPPYSGSSGSAGSGTAMSHIPKYVNVQYIIKVN